MADILLAGGDEAGRLELSRMLACYGHVVRPEENAGSAARAHRSRPAELLILDLGDGRSVEAIDAFRREDEELPILALAGDESLVGALDAGADAALAAPVRNKLRLLYAGASTAG